jgi:hypothetical protein
MRILIALAMLTLSSLSAASDDAFKSIYMQFEATFKSRDADKVSKWLSENYELLQTMSFPGVGLVGGDKSSKKKILSYMHSGIRLDSYPPSKLSDIRVKIIKNNEFCGYSSVHIPNKSMGRNKDSEMAQDRKVCFRLEGGKYVVYKHTIETYMMDKSAENHSISDDIQALSQFSQEAQQAGNRLVGKGEKILPETHKALLNKSSNLKLIMQLVTVLGQIGDPRSIGPIIKAAKMHPDNPFIYQNALRSFAFMTPTRETDAFAEDQLINDRPRIMQRMALYYLAMHKDRRARKWVDKRKKPGQRAIFSNILKPD